KPLMGIAFSPDGRTLHGLDQAGTLWKRDAETNQGGGRVSLPAPEFQFLSKIVLASRGKILAVAGPAQRAELSGHTVRLIELDTGAECLTLKLPGFLAEMALSPDGKSLATLVNNVLGREGPKTPEIRLWNVPSGEARGTLDGRGIGVLAFAPDGQTL